MVSIFSAERIQGRPDCSNLVVATRLIWLLWSAFLRCAAVATLLPSVGCSQAPAEKEMVRAGGVSIGLRGISANGINYRLRNATITIQGPAQTLFFNTEDDPNRTEISADVAPGAYTTFLQEGWLLERLDADAGKVDTVVAADLSSPNPQTFQVVENRKTTVSLQFRVQGEVVVGNPGSFGLVLDVRDEPPVGAACVADASCGQGQSCCPLGLMGECTHLEDGEACPLPDLTVSQSAAQTSLHLTLETFTPESCALVEGCVAQPGPRRLLRFSTQTSNVGAADVILGDPRQSSAFTYSSCHGHYHFEGYAQYELVTTAGDIVAAGHKQAFCLMDSTPLGLPGAPPQPRFDCSFQGIERGWSDIYPSNLDCQWIDVTDVAPGDYVLRITVNPDRTIAEADYDNDVVQIPVNLSEPIMEDQLAPCAGPELGVGRSCGWVAVQRGTPCSPGSQVVVGCGCSGGTCAGDTVMRICEGTSLCDLQTAIGFNDDVCGLCSQVTFTCPPSGAYTVLTGSYNPLVPATCVP